MSSSSYRWSRDKPKDPIDVDPVPVTVVGPDGNFSVYSRARADSAPMRRFIVALRRIWTASALTQVPGWFEQWWNKGSHRPARPKTQSTWALIRAGKWESLNLDQQALLQIAAFLLLVLLVLFLVYLLHDSWVQGHQGVTVSASSDGKPSGRITFLTRSQFERERNRRKVR